MPSEFDGSVAAIINKPGKLLGTGIVLSSGLLLSCAHLLDGMFLRRIGDWRKLPSKVTAICGSTALHPMQAVLSRSRDLCCLQCAAIPGSAPIRLARARRLKSDGENNRVTAVGYIDDESGPRRDVVHDLAIIREQQSDNSGWLQCGQLDAGLQEGFSGGLVLARMNDSWATVGMLQLGNKFAATSQFIGVDAIAEFLKECNLNVAIVEFQPEPAARKRKPELHGDGNQNRVNFRGSVTGSSIRIAQKIERD